MAAGLRILLVGAGASPADALVSSWLSEQDVELRLCRDAFEACVALLREHDQPADLVLISLDQFGPGDQLLPRYVRESWPATVIVLYGDGPLLAEPDRAARVVVCPSAALRALLAERAAAVVARLRGHQGGHAARPAAPVERHAPPAPAPAARAPAVPTDKSDTAASGGPHRPSARDLLSREELASLLKDTGI